MTSWHNVAKWPPSATTPWTLTLLYPNGASYLHMKHAHDMQNADTEYPFCWLEARHSSWLLAFFAIKLIHELSCIYQTYIIHKHKQGIGSTDQASTEIDLFFSIYPIWCIRMQGTVWLGSFHSAIYRYCDTVCFIISLFSGNQGNHKNWVPSMLPC